MTQLTLAATQSELFQEALTLMIVGMGVVFIGLVLLMMVSVLIGKFGSERKASVGSKPVSPPPNHRPAPATPATEPAASDRLDPKVVAVIAAAASRAQTHDPKLIAILTAAASSALNRPVHMRSARRFLEPKGDPQRSWSQSGRRSIMTSHRPQRK